MWWIFWSRADAAPLCHAGIPETTRLLGQFAEVVKLVLVQKETEEAVHTCLWEAVRTGRGCCERYTRESMAAIPENVRSTNPADFFV